MSKADLTATLTWRFYGTTSHQVSPTFATAIATATTTATATATATAIENTKAVLIVTSASNQ